MKIFFVVFIFITVISALLLWMIWGPSPQSPSEQVPSFPSPTDTVDPENQKAIVGQEGVTVFVRDFIADAETTPDPVNPGMYQVGTYLDPTDPQASQPRYVIEYYESTDYFSITLLQEPIGEVRREMEAQLRSQLNLSEDGMCILKYMVSVPNRVNQTYAGYDLRFSFCPDAIPLGN